MVVTAADKDLNSPIGCPSRRRVKSPRTESGTRMPLPVSGPTSATHQRASLGSQGTLGAQAAAGDDGSTYMEPAAAQSRCVGDPDSESRNQHA